ncbi:GNAT family N-acetyltransferase [Croceimicrobium sp.]|uniref:GNAT family N-acetyltransferase n=1 Tax=Croceimicrobium sp. TaxID=2828340 RepID=UPI003BACF042
MKINLGFAKMEDLPAIKNLFEASIRQTCQADYSAAEIEAWLQTLQNKDRWEELIKQQVVWLAMADTQLAGFCSLKAGDYLDFMYVSPHHQGMGLAKLLLKAAVLEARKQGKDTLSSDISITARPFFDSQGWKVIRKNENPRGDQVLINYRMEFRL